MPIAGTHDGDIAQGKFLLLDGAWGLVIGLRSSMCGGRAPAVALWGRETGGQLWRGCSAAELEGRSINEVCDGRNLQDIRIIGSNVNGL